MLRIRALLNIYTFEFLFYQPMMPCIEIFIYTPKLSLLSIIYLNILNLLALYYII